MPIGDKKPKVVIDTNVFISGLNFDGKPAKILNLFIKEKIEVYISPFILEEIEKILKERFDWDQDRIKQALALIKDKTIEVQPKFRISVVKEKEDDNRIIECSIEGKVRYIISGDKHHLLPLKEYKGIKILSPAEFLNLWQ